MRWLGFFCAAVLGGALGCSSTCGDLQEAAKDCGTSFNSNTCSDAMASCSTADQQHLVTAANCEENSQVCNNGAIVSFGGYLGCVAQLAGTSGPCLSALNP